MITDLPALQKKTWIKKGWVCRCLRTCVCSVSQTPRKTLHVDPVVPLHIWKALGGQSLSVHGCFFLRGWVSKQRRGTCTHCTISGWSSGNDLCCRSHPLSEFSNEERIILVKLKLLEKHKLPLQALFFMLILLIHTPLPPSLLPSTTPPPLSLLLPRHRVCVETQPTVQRMNNLAVCVSSVYRANPSVSRHLSIRACLVIVHPRHTRTQMRIHKHTHIARRVHTRAPIWCAG